MEILITGYEADEIYKIGGLGDYTASIADYFSKIDGFNVKVIMPKHKWISEKLEFVTSSSIGDKPESIPEEYANFGLYHKKLRDVDYYFIENDFYFNRNFIYDPENECIRYAFLSRAIIETIKVMDWNFDIIHMNDFTQGIIPTIYKHQKPEEKLPKFLITIHSVYFNGNFELDDEMKKIISYYLGFEWEKNSICLLKEAIIWSDKVVCVGESTAQDIQTPEQSYGLDNYLREKGVTGILNGVNYDLYPRISDFDEFLDNKRKAKLKLQKKFNLEVNKDIPLLMYCGRLGGSQKGCHYLLEIMDDLMAEECQFILLANGVRYKEEFIQCSKEYPNFIACIKHDPELARELYEASDMLLMPSKCEPNGLSQIFAMYYGSVPIVHNTGGLKDTIIDYLEYNDEGNGFKFYNYEADEFLNVIIEAFKIFRNEPETWVKIMKNGYNEDYSWENMITPYVEIYKSLGGE